VGVVSSRPFLLFGSDRRVHGAAALVGLLYGILGREATINEYFIGQLSIALAQLIEHRRQFFAIVPGVGHFHTQDHAAMGVGRELNVVSRLISSVGKLHDPRVGVGGRSPRFAPLTAVGGFALPLQFLALTHRFFDPLLSLARGTLPRCALASR